MERIVMIERCEELGEVQRAQLRIAHGHVLDHAATQRAHLAI